MREAHVPTQQSAPQQEARLPSPYVDPRGSRPPEEPENEGPHPPVGVIWRVRAPREFRAFTFARRHRRGPLVLTCCPATIPGPPRVAYAVGRRAGDAVARNRIRRRLRHVVAAHESCLRRDHQYLVGAGPAALRASHDELTTAWLELVDRAHEDRP